MEQHNGHSLKLVENVAPAEIATLLGAAEERAREQRVAVEQLLAEAKSLEEKLAVEALQARAAAQRQLAQEQAAAAVAAAQLERQAITQVETCALHLAELTRQRNAVEIAADGARAARQAAEEIVAECEERLENARAAIARAVEAGNEADARRAELDVAHALAETQAQTAARQLAEHRAARQRAENASSAHRALALRTNDETTHIASLAHVEELRLLEASIGLRTEAATRAAERRASDAARNYVVD
jgi:hypothetical protein